MYMCQVVLFGVILIALEGCFCVQVGGRYGVSKEVIQEAVEEVVSKNRKQGTSEEFPRF